MFVFHKARSSRQTLNDLDAYIRQIGDEPVKWLAREVQNWGEFSYSELETAIADGLLNELIDWQERYAEVVNNSLAPMWAAAMIAASKKATNGKVVLDDSDVFVKEWLKTHGGELITQLSAESRRAVAAIILHGQAERMLPRDMAKQIRPLIGLTEMQARANVNYREKVYRTYIENGATSFVAAAQADKAALKYAGKQHRYRAETIVHTELAFAYNRGAHMGVSQAIAGGLMGRCEMVWTTAGTNRVCGRCLALKDTVVGHTDESGVTLPPLHPRCRCAIMYNEVAAPKKPRGLAAGNIDTTTTEGSPPKLIGKLESVTEAAIQKTLEHYEKQIIKATVEHAVIITAIGEIYHCNGDIHEIPFEYFTRLADKLVGAHVTHNHPPGAEENENTFSDDDFKRFVSFKMARLRGIDEKFIYELNLNEQDNEFYGHDLTEIYKMGFDFEDYHYGIMILAWSNGLGYWRQPR